MSLTQKTVGSRLRLGVGVGVGIELEVVVAFTAPCLSLVCGTVARITGALFAIS